MTMPAAVRIGYRRYVIMPLPEDGAIGQHGSHCSMTMTIRVRPTPDRPSEAANTLLHEMLHASWDLAGLGRKAPEEKAITAISNHLCQTIQDNPAVWDWIIDQLRSQGNDRT
jgi:hypothetical protein